MEKTYEKCKLCGSNFELTRNNRLYCSRKCFWKHNKKPNKEWPEKQCKQCRGKFKPNVHNQAFCTKECSKKFRISVRDNEKNPQQTDYEPERCENCSKTFKPITHHHKYCSEECRTEFWRKKLRGHVAEVIKSCLYCENEFSTSHPGKVYCSKICRDNYKKEYRPNIQYQTVNKPNTEIIEMKVKDLVKSVNYYNLNETGILLNQYNIGGFSENLRMSVKERDKFKCQICDCETNLEVHHIIPQQKGGSHSLDNLITLCTKCHRHIETGDEEHAVRKCVRNYLKAFNSEDEDITNKKIKIKNNLEMTFKLLKETKREDLQEILILIDETLELIND